MTQVPDDINSENWGALRTLSLYRWTISTLLIGLWWSDQGSRILPGVNESFLPLLCALYLVTSPLLSLVLLFKKPGYQLQTYIHVAVDIALTTVLVFVCGGMSSGLGVLMLTPVGGIGTLIPRRTAILFAAIASLSLLAEEIFRDVYDYPPAADYTLAGLVGILTFIVCYAANRLAHRAKESAKLAEQRGIDLANLSHLNERIIHHMAAGVIVLDETDHIRMMNMSALRLLDAKKRNISGSPIASFAPQLLDQLKDWRKSEKATFDGDPVLISSHRVLPHFSRLGKAQGPALIFLEDASRFIEQSQQIKLNALGRLTASIAHEIRNPLGAISHASQIIQEWKNSPEEESRLLDIIDRHCLRINAIVENVLNLSKRQDTVPQSFDLGEWLVKAVDDYMHTEFGSQCEFNMKNIPNDFQVRFDPGHLSQIVHNLWDNAHQHSTQSDAITEIMLKAGFEDESGRPYLDIFNAGPAIPEELVEQIFEPFFTGMNNGTGLGLYLARELCECNNASVSYIQQSGEFVCFRILFANTLEWAA